jgi:hypothetical protein
MPWVLDGIPDHVGELLGLVPSTGPLRFGDAYRELEPVTDGSLSPHYGQYLQIVQLGCSCGWRSSRMEAPTSACWRGHVDALAWFQDQCRRQWAAHAIDTTFSDQDAANVRAGR